MRNRSLGALLLVATVVPFTSCSVSPSLTSIALTPSTVTVSMTPGLFVTYTAIGSYTRPGHAAVTKDITNTATWSTSFPQFVTVDSNGVATVTGYGYGTGNVIASAPGFHGTIVGSSSFIIQKPTAAGAVKTLTLTPSKPASDGSVQFTAVGRAADGKMVELSGPVTWVSTDSAVGTMKNSGVLAVAGSGRTTITAVYSDSNGMTVVGKTSYMAAGQN